MGSADLACNLQGGESMIKGGSMEQKKERKTAASIRRVIEDRLEEAKRSLAAHQASVQRIEDQIEMLLELLEATAANGKEEGDDGQTS